MEIELKYIIEEAPKDLNLYPHKHIQQGYLSFSPVIRIRQIDSNYILTIKGKGLIQREEYELEITETEFKKLSKKTEGILLDKTRYYIPYKHYTIELDVFHKEYEPLILAEVEFDSIHQANVFIPPDWFGENVSGNPSYQNNNLASNTKRQLKNADK